MHDLCCGDRYRCQGTGRVKHTEQSTELSPETDFFESWGGSVLLGEGTDFTTAQQCEHWAPGLHSHEELPAKSLPQGRPLIQLGSSDSGIVRVSAPQNMNVRLTLSTVIPCG